MRLKVFVIALLLSVGLATPMPNPERKELLKPLGKSQFIETKCSGSGALYFYEICGETSASFELFSALLNLYFTTDLAAGAFDWEDAWKKTSADSYSRTFTYKKREYTISYSPYSIMVLSLKKQ